MLCKSTVQEELTVVQPRKLENSQGARKMSDCGNCNYGVACLLPGNGARKCLDATTRSVSIRWNSKCIVMHQEKIFPTRTQG
jgi:hypothetical protein